jgi:hypothetical protein
MPELSADLKTLSPEELRARLEQFQFVKERDFQQLLEDEARGRPAHKGFIYVLSNPSMPGLIKVGSTSGPVANRVAQLNNPTSVPEPFRIEFVIPVYESLRAAERKAHTALDIYRCSKMREFFRLSPDLAQSLLENTLGEKAKRLPKDQQRWTRAKPR